MKSIKEAIKEMVEAVKAWRDEAIMWKETHRSFGYYGIRRKGGK